MNSGLLLLFKFILRYRIFLGKVFVVCYILFFLFQAMMVGITTGDPTLVLKEVTKEVIALEYGIQQKIDIAVNDPNNYTLFDFLDIIVKIFVIVIYFQLIYWVVNFFLTVTLTNFQKVLFSLGVLAVLQIVFVALVYHKTFLPILETIWNIIII